MLIIAPSCNIKLLAMVNSVNIAKNLVNSSFKNNISNFSGQYTLFVIIKRSAQYESYNIIKGGLESIVATKY